MKNILFILIFLFPCISRSQVPSYVPTNGLVGWWGFNGNADDESGNGSHGIPNGATLTSDRFGNTNAAYEFNGGAYISGNSSDSLNVANTQQLTMSCWININSIPPSTPDCKASRIFTLTDESTSSEIVNHQYALMSTCDGGIYWLGYSYYF